MLMLMFSNLKERINHFFFHIDNDWEIGYTTQPFSSFLSNDKVPNITWLKMPRNVFWADPFAIERNDTTYLFFEEYLKEKQYGVISCMAFDKKLNCLWKKIIIDEGVHFSFPFIVEYQNDLYMMPETSAKSKLSLYKSTNFPLSWQEEHVLLDIPCEDSILYHHNDSWWLFYNRADRESGNLYLRTNKNLVDGWSECEEILINTNTYNSRNAGHIIKHNNKLYRLSQNCSKSYGESIVINQLENLSDTDYKETIVKELTIKKTGGINGFHTLTECNHTLFTDRRRYRFFLKTMKELTASVLTKISN
jgi:hypothetical protein